MVRQFQLVLKRLSDVIFCLVIIIIGFPIFVVIALLVKFSSPGPIFFVQERVGLKQKYFSMIKFRTMTGELPTGSAPVWNKAEDARITSIGRILRDYGLDELPQVINILKGDLSIVGPRSPVPAELKYYKDDQLQIFQMRPGVLSLAAIEGRRSIPMEKRIELHLKYTQNWSLKMDIRILWRAFFVVLRRQSATESIVD
jgi:lipopolysaccharide/colanic/teichoic acid biosynthesis glycosyltransferase